MGRSKKYTDDYKEIISNLYKSGMTIPEISSEYGIAKSTIAGWVKDNSKVKVSNDEFMTMKEIAQLKKENEILKKGEAYPYFNLNILFSNNLTSISLLIFQIMLNSSLYF